MEFVTENDKINSLGESKSSSIKSHDYSDLGFLLELSFICLKMSKVLGFEAYIFSKNCALAVDMVIFDNR